MEEIRIFFSSDTKFDRERKGKLRFAVGLGKNKSRVCGNSGKDKNGASHLGESFTHFILHTKISKKHD